MKSILLSLAIFGLTGNAIAQVKGIKFENELTWTQVKDKAKTENKYIFVDAFATWCGPCKFMDDSVYTSKTLGSFINDKFISIKVQMDSTSKDDQKIKNWYADVAMFKKQYKIGVYPSLLFFNPNGVLVHKTVGAMTDSSFLTLAARVLNPSDQFYSRLRVYKTGKLDYQDMPALARAAIAINENSDGNIIANDYIENYLLKLKKDDLFTKANLEFLGDFLITSNSNAFKLFFKEQQRVNATMGNFYVQNKIMTIINWEYLPQNIEDSKVTNWDVLEKKMTDKFGSLGQEIIWGQRMVYHFMAENDWRSFGEYYLKYFKKGLKRSRYEINNMSWAIFQHVDDPKVVKFACDVIMKYALEKYYSDYANAYDTYANLLHKIGRTREAIKWEEKAVQLKKGQSDEQTYMNVLEKMKKGEKTWVN